MKRLIIIAVILVGTLFALPVSPPAHAQFTGVVCLTPSTSTKCAQNTPFTFGPTAVGSSFTIGVFVNNSDPMGGFDIYVAVDPTYLNATSATFGTLIPTADQTLSIICINNKNVVGACNTGTANGNGVIEVSTSDSRAQNECNNVGPCSGMAATITFQALTATPSNGTAIQYPTSATGCSSSSTPNACVFVNDFTGPPLPETVMTADFAGLNPAANFVASPATGSVPLTVAFSASSSAPSPGQTISQYNWAFGDGTPFQNVTTGPTIRHTYVTPGNFTPSLEVVDSAGLKSAIKDSLVIGVFCSFICAKPGIVNVFAGRNASSIITLSGILPFNGTISLPTPQVSPSTTNPPTATLNQTSATVLPGKTKAVTLNVTTTTSTTVGTYTINVTGVAKTVHYSVLVSVVITLPDFGISASPSSLTVSQGGNSVSTITLTSKSGLSTTVTLSTTNSSKYVLGFSSPPLVKLTSTAGTNSSTLYVIVASGTPAGNYRINVTGMGPSFRGIISHTVQVTVTVPPPNFGQSATPTTITTKAGTNATSAITLTGLNGFSDTISLQANSSSSLGIKTVFSSTSVSVDPTSGPVSSTLTISTVGTTPANTYTITINATATTLHIQHLVNITLTVVSPLPSVQLVAASLSIQSTTAGNQVQMTVSIGNTGGIPVNLTITMDVNGGTGSNYTVAQTTVTLNPAQKAQTFTLSWNTTQWLAGKYQVYARIIGSQTRSVNQAETAGTETLASPPSSGGSAFDLTLVPWITTAVAAGVAVVLGLILFRRKALSQPSQPRQ